ncbi:MAG: cellulase family glycosylhydrolase [Opitutaceae bacterium]|nr:cellulase family glycosylhydrolase [Opitutaceae bacterium]
MRFLTLCFRQRLFRSWLGWGLLPWLTGMVLAAAPVEFTFSVSTPGPEAFARDLWADLALPDGSSRSFPAFYDGGETWKVRVAARWPGTYRLLRVEERSEGLAGGVAGKPLPIQVTGPRAITRTDDLSAPAIRVDPANRRGFVRGEREPYLPFGLNLAWGSDAFYAHAFSQCQAAGLNWTRVWMAPWAELDLSWLPPERGASPAAGHLDLAVARRWDRILDLAERAGVAVQVVVFSHGQLSTEVNPVWATHPWAVAQGGFLQRPADFFTAPEARRHTRTKLRYLTARYGHSPAVMAWELFNEVNFTDAWRLQRAEAEVVRWHDEMAAWLRRNDPHSHLVTTSLSEAPVGPLWRSMDYYQPHVYPVNGLSHVRRFPLIDLPPDKPLFYGEIGDDHQAYLSPGDKESGAGLVPVLWSGLMADHALPAQTWYWQRLLDHPRWGELASVGRFVREARLAERLDSLRAFDPFVETGQRVPHQLGAGFHWALRGPAVIEVTTEGREPAVLADVPEYVVAEPELLTQGRTDRLTLRLQRERPGNLQFHLTDVGPRGATVLLRHEGEPVVSRTWEAEPVRPQRPLRPATLTLPVPAGRSEVLLLNQGPDAFRLHHVDLDQTVPALAATGRRSDRFVMVYLWHRLSVHAAKPGAPATGTLVIDTLPAGNWTLTWWDLEQGKPKEATVWHHPGGPAKISTPPIARHATLMLERDQ